MNITISSIAINNIEGVGSVNIGKTILCHNKAVSTSTAYESDVSMQPKAEDQLKNTED